MTHLVTQLDWKHVIHEEVCMLTGGVVIGRVIKEHHTPAREPLRGHRVHAALETARSNVPADKPNSFIDTLVTTACISRRN